MNDEIKATLEWLKECGDNDYIFETGNSTMLLDYITSLQQENEYLKSSIADYQEAVGDYQDEIVRKDNNWNELKIYIKASDDCWDLQAVLDKIKELENETKNMG